MMRRDLDERELTQLAWVNQELERRLKGMGYSPLWLIAFADPTNWQTGAESAYA